jgi:hypothetical protein
LDPSSWTLLPNQALSSAERIMQRHIERSEGAAAADKVEESVKLSSGAAVAPMAKDNVTGDVCLGRRLLAHLLSSSTKKSGKSEQMGFFAGR